VNIPLIDGPYNPARDCAPSPGGDCIIAAIDRFSAILADASRPDDERAEALEFLVHFVADLHQPLHATTKNDRGGNDTKVTFFGHATNLYAVWDYGLMEHAGLTVTAWANLLNRSGLPEDGSGTTVQWAEESVRVAAEHCYRVPASHEIGQAYRDVNLPVLRQQLFRAGVRLATLLNAIFERAAH
jgi:nuclease S1